jgi:3-oxoacyl-(acyl-carrier-protein) synthase
MESDLNSSPVITGFGLVTALGRSASETWHALVEGRSISNHARVPGFSGPRRVTAMALQAASEALAHAGWTETDLRQGDCGLFVGTSKGEIESWAEPANSQNARASSLTPSPCTADRRSQGDERLSEAKSRSIGSEGSSRESNCLQSLCEFL